MAGNGPVSVETRFAKTSCCAFEVLPRPTAIHQTRGVSGAQVRVFGVGFDLSPCTQNPGVLSTPTRRICSRHRGRRWDRRLKRGSDGRNPYRSPGAIDVSLQKISAQDVRRRLQSEQHCSLYTGRMPQVECRYFPVSICARWTGLDSGEPFSRSQIESATRAPTAKNSLCQFCKDSNQNRDVPTYCSTETWGRPCSRCSPL